MSDDFEWFIGKMVTGKKVGALLDSATGRVIAAYTQSRSSAYSRLCLVVLKSDNSIAEIQAHEAKILNEENEPTWDKEGTRPNP